MANKGKRFLSYMSMTCLAYGLALLLDKHEYWNKVVEVETSLITQEEKLQYKQFRRNKKSVSEEARKRFNVAIKNKFTTRKGREVGFGRHGFSNEGVRYYKNMARYLRGLDDKRCCGILTCWDDWTEANGFAYEWKPGKGREDEREHMEEDQENDADDDDLILEGEEGHEEFQGWAAAEEGNQGNKESEQGGNAVNVNESDGGVTNASVNMVALEPVTPNERNRGDTKGVNELNTGGRSESDSDNDSDSESDDNFLFQGKSQIQCN